MDVFAAERGSQQSPEQWRTEELKKLPPSPPLKNYEGHPLDILSHIHLSLSQGGQAIDTIVLVQKGAPNDLLLGTDVQPKLVFALVMEAGERVVDLLTGEECKMEGS